MRTSVPIGAEERDSIKTRNCHFWECRWWKPQVFCYLGKRLDCSPGKKFLNNFIEYLIKFVTLLFQIIWSLNYFLTEGEVLNPCILHLPSVNIIWSQISLRQMFNFSAFSYERILETWDVDAKWPYKKRPQHVCAALCSWCKILGVIKIKTKLWKCSEEPTARAYSSLWWWKETGNPWGIQGLTATSPSTTGRRRLWTMKPSEAALAIARLRPCDFRDFLTCIDFCEHLIGREGDRVDDGERSMRK